MSDFVENVDKPIDKAKSFNCKQITLHLIVNKDNDKHSKGKVLVGKVISEKTISLAMIKAILVKSWQTRRGYRAAAKLNNMFVFTFEHDVDAKIIIENRPWTINNQQLAIAEWPPNMSIEEISFSYSPFWVQTWRLPLIKSICKMPS